MDANIEASSVKQEGEFNKVESKMRYSGFWVRFAAYIVDSIILQFVIMPVYVVLMVIAGAAADVSGGGALAVMLQIVNFVFSFVVTFAYYIFMTYQYQATLGKMAVGAKVVKEDGKKMSLKDIVIREVVGKFVSSITLGIGYVIAAFTGKKQGLHDMIASSVVAYKDPKRGPNKIVVGFIYGGYTLLMLAIMAFIAFIAVIASMSV